MASNAFQYYQANKEEKYKNVTNPTQKEVKILYLCSLLDELFEIYGVKRMIIGHNLQQSGMVGTYCQVRLYLIDVGMSSFYGGNLAVLRIDAKTEELEILTDPTKQ